MIRPPHPPHNYVCKPGGISEDVRISGPRVSCKRHRIPIIFVKKQLSENKKEIVKMVTCRLNPGRGGGPGGDSRALAPVQLTGRVHNGPRPQEPEEDEATWGEHRVHRSQGRPVTSMVLLYICKSG